MLPSPARSRVAARRRSPAASSAAGTYISRRNAVTGATVRRAALRRNHGNPEAFRDPRARRAARSAGRATARRAWRRRATGGPRPCSRSRTGPPRSPCWTGRWRPARRRAARWRQLAARLRTACAHARELGASLVGPPRRPHRVERGHRRFERAAGRSPLAQPPLPAAEHQERAGLVEAEAGGRVPVRGLRECLGRQLVVSRRCRRTIARAARGGDPSPGMVLPSASSASRRVMRAASSAAPCSTSASTSSGATGNTPGSSTPSRSACSQTGRSRAAARAGSCAHERRHAPRPEGLQSIPVRRRSPWPARARGRPSGLGLARAARGLRPGAPGSAPPWAS